MTSLLNFELVAWYTFCNYHPASSSLAPLELLLRSVTVCGRLQKTHLFWKREPICRSRSSNVDDFGTGTNRQRIYDFLLVRH